MRKITQEEIIEITCREYGITPEALLTRSRRDPLPTVRAIIAHLLYRELGMFPRDILPLTGHPADHRTAVYYYLGRRTLVESRLPFNKELGIARLLNCLAYTPARFFMGVGQRPAFRGTFASPDFHLPLM